MNDYLNSRLSIIFMIIGLIILIVFAVNGMIKVWEDASKPSIFRRIKSQTFPSCKKCKWFTRGTSYCINPTVVEEYNKKEFDDASYVPIANCRATKYCTFEQREEASK